MHNAEMVAELPELSDAAINAEALRIAALYHDAGWAVQVRAGQVSNRRALTRPTNDIQFELAAELVESSLADMLPPQTVARASEAIRRMGDKQCDVVEAAIVSDADNLDQIGPLGFLQTFRRDVSDGRAFRHVLETWHRQQEYHYWEARIRDGIRFEPVRKLAWRRLAAMEPFMQALAQHMDGCDLAELVGLPAVRSST
jgi:hypothetical protein